MSHQIQQVCAIEANECRKAEHDLQFAPPEVKARIVISRGFNGKEIGLVVFIRGLGGSSRQIHAEEVLAPTITRQKTANEKCFFYMCDYANLSTFLRGCEWT